MNEQSAQFDLLLLFAYSSSKWVAVVVHIEEETKIHAHQHRVELHSEIDVNLAARV